ncbi:MAG: acylneuraminate cytidylyltransferase family protein [Candidatus Latescibacterota bacterium]|nr:acylneuraminate cytidylyltransferase family protein [Candidatus Latescibacterota bacterium]
MADQTPCVLGVIPARGGSKGLPGKNILPLCGKPLIVHTIEAARASSLLWRTIVSTDDKQIADVAREFGAEVPFLRPSEFAADDTPLRPVLRHATEHMEAELGSPIDRVALLQPTSPFRSTEDIDGCIAKAIELDAEIVFSAKRTSISPYYNLIEEKDGGPWVKLCKETDEVLFRRQQAPLAWITNGAVAVYAREVLFREVFEHSLVLSRSAVYEMPDERILDVDTEKDLRLAEFLMSRFQKEQCPDAC